MTTWILQFDSSQTWPSFTKENMNSKWKSISLWEPTVRRYREVTVQQYMLYLSPNSGTSLQQIVTPPPAFTLSPWQIIYCWSISAVFRWLKRAGLSAFMCGHAYLNVVLRLLCMHAFCACASTLHAVVWCVLRHSCATCLEYVLNYFFFF